MKIICLLSLLFALTVSRWQYSHQITGEASKQLSTGIRSEILNNIYLILNPSVKSALIHDLDELDDSKRTLASIDNLSVSAIFSIFDLKDPHCDTNKDGSVSGDELRCFSKIWKNFVPNG